MKKPKFSKSQIMNKLQYWFYHFIYVPIFSLWDDYRHGNEAPTTHATRDLRETRT
jgi:hypothetical protein